jgi:hypothetical protein
MPFPVHQMFIPAPCLEASIVVNDHLAFYDILLQKLFDNQ